MRLGLIGYGTIARTLLAEVGGEVTVTGVLVRPGREADGQPVVTTAAELIEGKPDLVIECAGHGAVRDHVPDCLKAGIDVVVASIGALSDDALYDTLKSAAKAGGARLILPAGAVGGIDALAALSAAGRPKVRYTGTKPPRAWAGSPAEDTLDLASLTEPQTFFEGTAREAASAYPKNANVAATIALAGAGFDATTVTLVADPAATGNTHEFEAVSDTGRIHFRIENAPSGNAKTSMATVYSLVREVRNRKGPVVI